MANDGDRASGWYPDPELPDTQRLWDGTEWTEHVAPATLVPQQAAPSKGLETLGAATAVFVPPVGLVIGLFLIGKSKSAGAIIGVAVAALVFWAVLVPNL